MTFARTVINFATLIAMGGVAIAEISYRIFGFGQMAIYGRYAYLAVALALLPRLGIREWSLGVFALTLTYFLAETPGGFETILLALDRAGFFAAFILLITLVKEGAITSPSILKVGHYLTNQPPSSRFLTVATGGHFFGALLNFGAVSLLAPLIQRGVRAEAIETPEDERRAIIREQRQLTALIRGFCWMICWAPTAMTQAIIAASVPDAKLSTVIGLGLMISLIMILIGWLEEKYAWRHINPRTIQRTILDFPTRAFFYIVLIGCWLVVLTITTQMVFTVTTAVALMLVGPIILISWVFIQNLQDGFMSGLDLLLKRLKEIGTHSMPNLTLNAFVLGLAGYIGVTGAALAPVDLIAQSLHIEVIPAWLFLLSLPIIITLGGQIAFSPILIVVFLAAVIAELPNVPADPSYIAFALGTGWALSMTAAPNATATLLIASVTDIRPTTLTWKWNGRYSLIAFAILALTYFILTEFFP